MSHKATNWAVQQRGMKPATKIVLWHLCDRHNPDYGCFPSQRQLAYDCEMSPSSLNVHLLKLEESGHIRREQSRDPKTNKQLRTRYMLGFEELFTQEPTPESGVGNIGTEQKHIGKPTPESGDGSDSGNHDKPTPEKDQSRLQNPESKSNPLKEPLKEEEDARSRKSDFEYFFAELLSALNFEVNATLPAWWQGEPARLHVRRWIDDLGLTGDRIISVATETRNDHPDPPDGPKALDRFMERAAKHDAKEAAASASSLKFKRSRKAQEKSPRSLDELAAFYAAKVNSDEFLPPSMISNTICAAMLARKLVTTDRLLQRGIL
jgi:hypothetical protein